LIIVPHLQKTFAQGAAFWLNKDKAVIMLTIRGSWADIFWFSLFHEIAHIVLHSKQEVFIESDNKNYNIKSREDEADNFAMDCLIPRTEYKNFELSNSFYKDDIKEFSGRIGIHAGVVVGRLHHEKQIDISWHNDLRERYKWGRRD
jgi:HTH-type transcriptional regulator/antitoxin HigA